MEEKEEEEEDVAEKMRMRKFRGEMKCEREIYNMGRVRGLSHKMNRVTDGARYVLGSIHGIKTIIPNWQRVRASE